MSLAIRTTMHTDIQAVFAIILSVILIATVYYFISGAEVNNTTTAIFQQANAMTIYPSSYFSSSSSSSSYVATAVRSEDHPPIAYSQSVQTTQNTPIAISFKAADPDLGDTIGYAILSQPSHGQLSNNLNSAFSGTIYYSPNNGFSGTDSFSVQAFDRDRLVSNVATIYITIIRVDHPPIAYSQSVQTTQNTPIAIHLSATSSDPGDSITSFAIVSMPSRGTITNFDQSSGALIYTPYHGATQDNDMFTFNTIDNRGTVSNIGAVSISINRGPS